MNNFEKRLFLEYFMKLLPEVKFDYNFERLFKDFLQIFNIPEEFFAPYYHKGSFNKDFNSVSKERKCFEDQVKKNLPKLIKKIPQTSCLLERQIKDVMEIFKLNDKECAFLLFLKLKSINSLIDDLVDCCKSHKNYTALTRILSVNLTEVNKICEDLENLSFISNIHGGIELDNYWDNIFNNKGYNTKKKIVSTLSGKSLKAKLSINDFKHIERETNDAIRILSAAIKENKTGINILLYGAVGTGKTEFAKLLAASADSNIYGVRTQRANHEELRRQERLADLKNKQYILKYVPRSCILFDEAEDVMNTGFSFFNRTASKGYLNHLLEGNNIPVIWTTNNIEDVDPAFLRRMTYTIKFEKLSENAKLNLWKKILRENKIKTDKSRLQELNKSYDVSPSIISNAASTASMIGGDIDDVERFIENVAQVVYQKEKIKKDDYFQNKGYDINLVNTDCNMDELTEKIKQSGKLNFSLCLYGEPGTGKSQYARYLADNLGISVILKKASDLISCYIGETEKNIARAFAEAKSKKAMLIIDEADSFLQNRNNAHRNWEITEVNEMLTWMESHQYPFVCTTNLINNLDEASLRRFTFKIKFDFLKPEQVNLAVEHFFGIKDSNLNIKGLTAGDFATVKKKIDFLGTKDLKEISKMLYDEVKIKKTETLQNSIGF